MPGISLPSAQSVASVSTPSLVVPVVGTARIRPWNRVGLIAVTVVLAWGSCDYLTVREDAAPTALEEAHAVPAAAFGVAEAPYFSRDWLTPAGHRPVVHCSSVSLLASGDLLASWYGGTREGAADVKVFTSRLRAGTSQWTAPETVIDRARAEDELDRSIKKVGNAVLFPDQVGNLWMVYATVSVGGWSGSALNIMSSRDEGHTWSASQRLTVNPFFNLSSLVRNKPIYASDGRIGLPVYHEMATKFPQMLWITPGSDGSVVDYSMRSLTGATGLLQPSLVQLDDKRVLMMLRDSSDARTMHTAYSDDHGWTWSSASPTGLPNPNSAVDGLRLRDGRILLVYNHAAHGRENLQLAVSSDQGRTWVPRVVLEQEPSCEFSYPQLTEDGAGRIHVTYTWRRERIRHVAFNLAWLDQQGGGNLAGGQ